MSNESVLSRQANPMNKLLGRFPKIMASIASTEVVPSLTRKRQLHIYFIPLQKAALLRHFKFFHMEVRKLEGNGKPRRGETHFC